MKHTMEEINNRWYPITSLLLLTFGWLLATEFVFSGYFNSSFLYADDTIYLGKYFLGEEVTHSNVAKFHHFLRFLTEMGGLFLVKLTILIYPALIVLCFVFIGKHVLSHGQ